MELVTYKDKEDHGFVFKGTELVHRSIVHYIIRRFLALKPPPVNTLYQASSTNKCKWPALNYFFMSVDIKLIDHLN